MRRTVTAALLLALILTSRIGADGIHLEHLGTYATGIYNQVAAEIGAHDPQSQRLFVTNSATRTIDVLDMRDPRSMVLLFTIPLMSYGDSPTSVAFKDGLGAVAVVADPKTDLGKVVFFTRDGTVLSSVVAGALPDSLTFTPDGKKVLVANEGEPNDEYTIDPEGSVSIIDVSGGGAAVTQSSVRSVSFSGFNNQKTALRARGIRIYGPKVEEVIGEDGEPETIFTEGGASVAQDIEPEFVSISSDSRTAFVTLQENNAFAIIDIQKARIQKLVPLGYKFHILPRNGMDASDRDHVIDIKPRPVRGMYLPDAIATFEVDGHTYLITANEGDTRDWDGFSEEERIGGLTLGGILALMPDLQENANLGRLKVTNSPPDGKETNSEGEDVYRRLYSFGGRSFSIWSQEGNLIFDSGDQLERVTHASLGDDFNSDNASSPSGDTRSDDKGPEPEGVAVGKVGGKTYGFIGLERPGGIAVYDISRPWAPRFQDYINNRDFTVEFNLGTCEACSEDCGDDCLGECEDCKTACKACEECPDGEDCAEECALCAECTPKFESCPECTPECMAVSTCTAECTTECIEKNCPMAGVNGRDPLDLGPEGVIFIPQGKGPAGFGPLVVVTNEVSGSTTVYEVKED